MSRNATKDLTTGSPMKLILGFGIPLLFGMLFQQFYNMMDTIIVGKFLGVSALASVGATGSINFMIIGFCMGVCNGFAIPVAQRFGAKDEHGMRKFVANSVWLSIIFAVVMAVLVCVFCRQILELMNTPEDIIDGSYSYIFVIFLGIPATYMYNLLSGIMRSLGDSKTPLYLLIFSSILNIILDLLSIIVLKMGVAGAAWATVIAQAVSGFCCLGVIWKKFPILHVQREEWQPDKLCILNLCNMGIPMGAAVKINMFLCCPYDAMGSTMATYAGQNVGAGKFDRLKQGEKSCTLLGLVYGIAAFIFILLFGKYLALLFVDVSEEVIINQAHLFLMCNSAFYFPLALVNIFRFTIQGMGFSRLAILAGVCEMIGRTVVAFVFVPIFGYPAVCFASPVAWILADCFLVPAFFFCVRSLEKRAALEDRQAVLEDKQEDKN